MAQKNVGKAKKKESLNKAIYVKASEEFVEMLNNSQWHLQMKPALIVREAVTEYLKNHLPRDVRGKILKHIK